MQLLLDYTAHGASWQSDFDARSEMRNAAGLSLLQIWTLEDTPSARLCLFECRDRSRAIEWLKVEQELHGAGVPKFLRTL